MSLLAPLGLVFLLAVPVVVLFYLLRVRFREVEVGSTYLWERLAHDLAAQDPWQKPRFTLLMLIQILLLALLALALARPAWVALAEESVFQVIVLDGSASMQATDVAPSRFAEAQRLARSTIGNLPAGSSVAVIVAKRRPEVMQPPTEDTGRAVAALAQARPGSTVLDLAAAMRLADALASGHTKARIDVYTDGAFDRPDDLPETPVATSYHLIGGGSSNAAITAIAARPDPQNNRRYQVFVRVHNYGSAVADVTLGLYADGTLADSRTLSLGPASSQDLIFDRLPDQATVIQARLLEADALAVDNSAATVLDRPRATKVLLVGAGNIFLQQALGLLPNVELFRVDPNRFEGVDDTQFDLIVFDAFLPLRLPRQNLLVVNPPDSPLIPVDGTVERPRVIAWESENPLLRYVSFADIRIQRASKVSAPGWARTLLTGDNLPLLLAGEQQGQRYVVLAFDIQESNLPLSAGFPILIANVVGYLEPAGVLQQRSIAAGETVTIQRLPQADEIVVERPDGTTEVLPPGGKVLYDRTDAVGIYAVRQSARGETLSLERFAANLTDDAESSIGPRAPQDVIATAPPASREATPMQREFWPWVVAAGVLLLTGEWWWYHRRA